MIISVAHLQYNNHQILDLTWEYGSQQNIPWHWCFSATAQFIRCVLSKCLCMGQDYLRVVLANVYDTTLEIARVKCFFCDANTEILQYKVL